jgi:hypothetical protein
MERRGVAWRGVAWCSAAQLVALHVELERPPRILACTSIPIVRGFVASDERELRAIQTAAPRLYCAVLAGGGGGALCSMLTSLGPIRSISPRFMPKTYFEQLYSVACLMSFLQ